MYRRVKQVVVKKLDRFQVTENVVSDVEANHLAASKFNEPLKENSRNINRIRINKNKPIVILNPSDKTLMCTIPIIFQGRLLIAEFPNLLTLYLNNAIASYNSSNDVLNQSEIVDSYQSGEIVRFTNQNFYNFYLLNRINTIFYLAITVELLLNSKIPDNFVYKKGQLQLSKKDIEERLSFKEKLRLVSKIMKAKGVEMDRNLFDNLMKLYSVRSNLVHPKTADSKLKGDYSMEHISITFSEELVTYIDSVIKIVNRWEPNLISFEDVK